MHLPHRGLLWLIAGLVAAAAVGVGVRQAFFSGGAQPARPALQATLDRLVLTGAAPGATAYVSGAHGTWAGSAGVAEITSLKAMPTGSRMRIESNSKTWLVAVILQLAQEHKLTLDDTVQQWLPGLLHEHGDQVTIRELLHDTSGLIDDNDLFQASPAQLQTYFGRIGDPALRAQLLAVAAKLRANPWAPVSALLFIKVAGWEPLVATPGTTYHHSNIGWNIAGLIAAKAGGKPLPELYRERIFQPLGLHATAFSPQGPIAGEHANGYAPKNGKLVDTTTMHPGKFSDGGIVTDAKNEATFLRAAMDGTLFEKSLWLDLYGSPATRTGCGLAYMGVGSGDGYHSYVFYDGTGTHVAVLLLNKNGLGGAAAARKLYCGA